MFHAADTTVVAVEGFLLTVKTMTLSELKRAEKVKSLPPLLARMIFGKIGGLFFRHFFKGMPIRFLIHLHNLIIRAQYGALLECPGDWRERLALTDKKKKFVELCNEEAKKRLAGNERSRLEYSIAILTAIVCSAFGGKSGIEKFLLPEGSFGKKKEKPLSPEEQLERLAIAMGAKVIDTRQDAINRK